MVNIASVIIQFIEVSLETLSGFQPIKHTEYHESLQNCFLTCISGSLANNPTLLGHDQRRYTMYIIHASSSPRVAKAHRKCKTPWYSINYM